MEKQKIKNISAAVVGLVFVFAIGTTVAPVFSGLSRDIFRIVSAEENESDQEDEQEEDESKDEEDDKQSEQEKKAAEQEREQAKKENERQRESLKKTSELNRSANNINNDEEGEDDEADSIDGEGDEEDESIEDLADIRKDLAKLEERIATLGNNGVDTAVFSAALNEIKNAVSAAEAITDPSAKERALDQVEDDIEDLEKMVKIALGWEDEDDEDGDANEVDDDVEEDVSEEHGSVVSQFVQNLNDIAEVDGGIGKQVRVIAQSQNDSQDEIAEAIDEVEERSGFVKFLIGPNYDGIENVQVEIGANQGRVNVLNQLLSETTDPLVKTVLREQIEELQEENAKLQSFVEKSEEGISLFGWLFRIIS